VKLLVYFGKKGVRTDIQGKPGTILRNTVEEIVNGYDMFPQKENRVGEPFVYIGIDESGKGDFFGPLVAAAVYINPDIRNELIRLRVRDSKSMRDSNITQIARQITQIKGMAYEIIQINPKKYNELYEKFANLNKLLAWAHAKALENLLERTDAKIAISDKFGNEEVLQSALQKGGRSIELIQLPKAEEYKAVAAASVLARGRFLYWLKKNSEKIGVQIPPGASKAVENSAELLFKKSKTHNAEEYVKLHFKTAERIGIR
jgi:ribonuclease HIII